MVQLDRPRAANDAVERRDLFHPTGNRNALAHEYAFPSARRVDSCVRQASIFAAAASRKNRFVSSASTASFNACRLAMYAGVVRATDSRAAALDSPTFCASCAKTVLT